MESDSVMNAVAVIAGAGLAGTAQGLVKGFLPSVTPEIGGAIGGGLLYYFGRNTPWARALGVGIIAGSLSPMISKMIPTVTTGAGAGGGAGAGAGGGSKGQVQYTPAQTAAYAYIARKALAY